MKAVFEKELLLETILKNLGAGDLKKLRRVSQQWNYRATRILLAKKLLTVTHAFGQTPSHEHAQKLLGLERTMKESALFPACTFAFSNSNFKSPDLQHLLHTFGHLIRTLDISLDNGDLPGVTRRELLHSFKHVLFVHLPNLERLTLTAEFNLLPEPEMSEDNEKTTTSEMSSGLNLLGKLKFLYVESALAGNVFEFIIENGVNIEEVELRKFHDRELFDILSRRRKMHLLISADIVFQDYYLDWIVARFGNVQLNVRKLNVLLSRIFLNTPSIWLQATNIFANLLHTCAHSLVQVVIPPLFYLPEFQAPVMPRLQSLFILVIEDYSEAVTSKGFKMSRVFPRLSRIYTQHSLVRVSKTWSEQMYENKFLGADYEDRVWTVNTLHFSNEPQLVCIQKLPLLFPNLKKVVILSLSKVSQVLNLLWNFPVLESVSFGVSIRTLENLENPSWNANAFSALDAGLTGISEENCARLSSSSEILDAATLKELRLKNSMLDAKRLESVFIEIVDVSTGKRTSPTKSVLSRVAFQYAFQMCPNVKVRITLSGKEIDNVQYLLDGVSPVLSSHVKIKKEKRNRAIGHMTISSYICTLTL